MAVIQWLSCLKTDNILGFFYHSRLPSLYWMSSIHACPLYISTKSCWMSLSCMDGSSLAVVHWWSCLNTDNILGFFYHSRFSHSIYIEWHRYMFTPYIYQPSLIGFWMLLSYMDRSSHLSTHLNVESSIAANYQHVICIKGLDGIKESLLEVIIAYYNMSMISMPWSSYSSTMMESSYPRFNYAIPYALYSSNTQSTSKCASIDNYLNPNKWTNQDITS